MVRSESFNRLSVSRLARVFVGLVFLYVPFLCALEDLSGRVRANGAQLAGECDSCEGTERIECPGCKGGGEVCPNCDEHGRVACVAPGCEEGMVPCDACEGRGMVFGEVKRDDRVTKTATACGRCLRKKRIRCSQCVRGRAKCSQCGGQPREVCSVCKNERQVVCVRCDRFVGPAARTVELCNAHVSELRAELQTAQEERDSATPGFTEFEAATEEVEDATMRAHVNAIYEAWRQYGEALARVSGVLPQLEQSSKESAEVRSTFQSLANELRRPVPTASQKLRLREMNAKTTRYERHTAAFSELLADIHARQAEFDAKVAALERLHNSQMQEAQQDNAEERAIAAAFAVVQDDVLASAMESGLRAATCRSIGRPTVDALGIEVRYFDQDAEEATSAKDAFPTEERLHQLPLLLDAWFRQHPTLLRVRFAVEGRRAGRGAEKRLRIQSFEATRASWQRFREAQPNATLHETLQELRPNPEYPRPSRWVSFLVVFGLIPTVLLISLVILGLTTDLLKIFA